MGWLFGGVVVVDFVVNDGVKGLVFVSIFIFMFVVVKNLFFVVLVNLLMW